MNPKVAVVALAAIVVAVVLVVVYGATRPPPPEDPRAQTGTVDRWFGGLRLTETLTVDDLAGAPCLKREDRTLKVGIGGSCVIRLPEKDSSFLPVTEVLTVMLLDGSPTLTLEGDEFEPQRYEWPDENWDDPLLELNAYDANTRLTVGCGAEGPCALRVMEQ